MNAAERESESGLIVDVSLTLGENEITAAFSTPPAGVTALFGPSGAGKTSILHAISGLITPQDGRITLGSQRLFDRFARINVAPHRRSTGIVFQDNRLFPHKTVKQNLLYGAVNQSRKEQADGLQKIARLLDIEPLLGRRPAGLSGGERKRVAIGRALLSSPRLLLMDEPLSGLDSDRRNDVMSYISRIAHSENIPIIYVTHGLDEVLRLADNMVTIKDGMVTANGSVAEVLNEQASSGLTRPETRATVVEGLVQSAGGKDGLSAIETPIGVVQIAGLIAPLRARVRLRLRASDISISLSKPIDLSISNVMPGRIIRITDDGPAASLVMLNCGAPVFARVTKQSVQRLNLQPGKRIYALIKALSVERVFIGGFREFSEPID